MKLIRIPFPGVADIGFYCLFGLCLVKVCLGFVYRFFTRCIGFVYGWWQVWAAGCWVILGYFGLFWVILGEKTVVQVQIVG